MGTMNRMAVTWLALAAALTPPPEVMAAAMSATRQSASPWRPKLRNTRTTVAAMKRAARKRRNVAKRRGAA